MLAVPIGYGAEMATQSSVARDEESRWIVVDGRRWRATDPSIPEPFRREFVNELMAAWRDVARARKAADPSCASWPHSVAAMLSCERTQSETPRWATTRRVN